MFADTVRTPWQRWQNADDAAREHFSCLPRAGRAAQLAEALSADDEQQRILPARLPRRRLSAAKSGKQLAPPATSP